MKKRALTLTVIFFLVIGLTMLFSGSATAYSKDKPMLLKCSIDNPEKDVKARTIKMFGDLVTERTGGRITFQYFYGGSLTKKPQFVDAVSKGIADIATGPISFVTGKIPELSPFEIYGAYDLSRKLELDKDIKPLLIELFADKGVYPLMNQYTGNTIFTHKEKFLKLPSDWQGAKMRLGGRWQSTLGKMWGASPVFLSPPDLYLAAQRGVIDGFMLIYDITYGLKLYEVTPYITDTELSNNIEMITLNLKKWETLTSEDKQIFTDTALEVEAWNMKETIGILDHIKEDIIAKGGKIHVSTDAEKAAYLKDSYSLWPEVEEASGEMGKKFIEILKKYR